MLLSNLPKPINGLTHEGELEMLKIPVFMMQISRIGNFFELRYQQGFVADADLLFKKFVIGLSALQKEHEVIKVPAFAAIKYSGYFHGTKNCYGCDLDGEEKTNPIQKYSFSIVVDVLINAMNIATPGNICCA